MDWLKKRVEEFRSKVRRFIDHNWHNNPEGDVFRSLDSLFVLGVARYKSTEKWQRVCWNTYRFVAVCSFCIIVLNFLDQISGKLDLVKATWHGAAVLATTLCFVKNATLNCHYESLQSARNYINSKPFRSGDPFNDSACRKKLFQRLQLTVLVYCVIMLMDFIIFNMPNSGVIEWYGTPRVLQLLGPRVAGGIHTLFIFFMVPVWFDKYFAGTGFICFLLFGFQIEYQIFVEGFANILDQVYSEVEQKLPNTFQAAPDRKCFHRDQLYWKCLKQRVIDQVKLHIELVEKIQLLQPIVKYLFGILYYNAMVLFSPMIYVVLFEGLSMTSVYLVSVLAFLLLECYGWCYFVESHQDINETLELEILNLMANIPHSELHHKKYAEIRTTLGIMKTFVQNDQRFSCGGVFPVTVEAYTDLLNICYSVLTFLLDIGKKW